jgi:tungstate transport system permease protein
VTAVLAGFGRSIAEVGAVQMVGGNIQFKTRVMTTAIMMQTNMGRFELAVALGVVLLVISFIINSLVHRIQEQTLRDRPA